MTIKSLRKHRRIFNKGKFKGGAMTHPLTPLEEGSGDSFSYS